MKLNFSLPTHIIFESECIKNHSELFGKCGKKAAVVTGRHSAKACGALDDVTQALKSQGIEYQIYDQVENNPSVETVGEISRKARDFGAQMVIGIGGGSPLDASKAVAILCANYEMEPLDLFRNDFTRGLPVFAVPTTAGTGSEATPYSVLLRRDLETKLSFGNRYTYPTYAFVDYRYTEKIGMNTTISTAVDAFTHVLEGYLGRRSNVVSDSMALVGIQLFGECMDALRTGEMTAGIREKLMLLSLLGGIVISQAGVTSPHGMGYCYTYFKDIPHGRANGLLLYEYLKFNYPCAGEKIDIAMQKLSVENIDVFGEKLEQIVGTPPELTKEEIDKFTELSMLQKGSLSNSPSNMTREVVRELWERQNNHVKL